MRLNPSYNLSFGLLFIFVAPDIIPCQRILSLADRLYNGLALAVRFLVLLYLLWRFCFGINANINT